MNFLFSFRGRIGRLAWWGGQLAIAAWIIIASLLFVAVAGLSLGDTSQLSDAKKTGLGASTLLFILAALIPIVWVSAATTVKRFHDRDKSGFWYFISFIPYIGGLWLIVECGFLSGTPGRNNYGNRGDTHTNFSPTEFDTDVEGHSNLDDLIQQRLIERQQQQSSAIERSTSSGGNSNPLAGERPVFGRRT